MNIVGLGYESGVGKDSIADYLVEQFGFIKSPFAYNLKVAAYETYKHLGLKPPEYYEGPLKDERRKEVYGPLKWNIVEFWVHMNTLCVPEPRHWIDLTLNEFESNKFYVIPDVRKPIEISAIKDLGGLTVWVKRKVPVKPEAKIDNLLRGKEHLFDIILNNENSFLETAIELTGIIDEYFGINDSLEL